MKRPCGSCALLALGFTLLTGGGMAAAQSPDTDALVKQAYAGYAELDFESALQLLESALQTKGNTRSQLVQIYHLRGLCLGSLQRYDEAQSSFARLLTLEPTFRLGEDVSPRVGAPFQQVLKQNPKRLSARSLPPPFAQKGKPLVLTFQLESDPLSLAKSLRVWLRRGTEGRYSSVATNLLGEGEYRVSAPALVWEGKKDQGPVSWYAQIDGDFESALVNFGDAMHPLALEVNEQEEAPLAAAAPDPESAWYQHWWVWALAGGVVAAITTTAVVLGTREAPSGPFDFIVEISTSSTTR